MNTATKEFHKKCRKCLLKVLYHFLVFFCGILLFCGAALSTVRFWGIPLAGCLLNLKIESGYHADWNWKEWKLTLEEAKISNHLFRANIGRCEITLYGLFSREGFHKIQSVRLADSELDFTQESETSSPEDEHFSRAIRRKLKALTRIRPEKPKMDRLILERCDIRRSFGGNETAVSIPSLYAAFDQGTPLVMDSEIGLVITADDTTASAKCKIHTIPHERDEGMRLEVSDVQNLVILSKDKHVELAETKFRAILDELTPTGVHFKLSTENLTPVLYEPLALSIGKAFGEFDGTVSFQDEQLSLDCKTSVKSSDLVFSASPFPAKPEVNGTWNAAWNLLTGQIKVNALQGELLDGNGGKLKAEQEGTFSFLCNQDGSFSFLPEAAIFELNTAPSFDLSLYHDFLPFPVQGHQLDAHYRISLEPEKNSLLGKAHITVQSEEETATEFQSDFEFATEGITSISSFRVSDSQFRCTNQGETLMDGKLTGKYDVKTLNLHGTIDYMPHGLCHHIGGTLTTIARILNDYQLNDVTHTADATLFIDFTKMNATWNTDSTFQHISFTERDETPLQLKLLSQGQFSRNEDEQDDNTWQIQSVNELSAKDEFSANIVVEGKNFREMTGRVTDMSVSANLMKQILRRYAPELKFLQEPDFERVKFAGGYRWQEQESELMLHDLQFEIDAEDGQMEVSGIPDFELNQWKDVLYHGVTMKLTHFPLTFWNPLFPKEWDITLSDGNASAEIEIKGTGEAKNLNLSGKLLACDVKTVIDEKERVFSRIGANGTALLDTGNENEPELVFQEINLDANDFQGRPVIFLSGKGEVAPSRGTADFTFAEVSLGSDILELIGYGANHAFVYDDLDATGTAEYHAYNQFKNHDWITDLKLKRFYLTSLEPEEYQFPKLSGAISGKFMWDQEKFSLFGDASAYLADENGKVIVKGSYLHPPTSTEHPIIQGEVLDTAFAAAYFQYNGHPNKQEEDEPYSPISFYDFTLSFLLKGLYLGDYLTGSAMLDMEFRDSMILCHQIKVAGDISGSMEAILDFMPEDHEFRIEHHLEDFQLEKVLDAYMAYFGEDEDENGNEEEMNLKGIISKFDGTISGAGFNTESLKKSFKATTHVKGGAIELHQKNKNRSQLTQILLLPFIAIPKLIDLLPLTGVRELLRSAIGSSTFNAATGAEPVFFEEGEADFTLSNGVLDLKSVQMQSDFLNHYSVEGKVSLWNQDVRNELQYLLKYGVFLLPIYVKGDSEGSNQVDYTKSILDFWEENTKHLLLLIPDLLLPNSNLSEHIPDTIKLDSSEENTENRHKNNLGE